MWIDLSQFLKGGLMADKKTGKWKHILVKALIVQIVFLVLHFSYDWWPNLFTQLFSGTSEAVFQHMKIGFYAYGLVSLIEIIILRKAAGDIENLAFTRLTSTILYCWFMFILFFAPPAYYGKYPADIYEIVSANIILYSTSVIAGIFELELSKIKLSKEFRIVIVVLGVIFLSLLVIYSFRDPWFDVFAIPPGWE
jgi:hypothetical protein